MPGAVVTTQRPDAAAAANAPTVNLYLYQVLPCGPRRNDDLPNRRGDGSVVQRPRASLDLGYLISFYGDEAELEPQRLLGSTVRTLTTRPLLGPDLFDDVVTAAGATPPVHPALVGSDLADAPEPVRLCPLPLDLEALSKLWSVFFQTPHALSIAWSASVVFVEESLAGGPSLPVVESVVSVAPMLRPTVTSVTVSGDPEALLTTDVVARLTGSQLAGAVTLVRLAGVDLTPGVVSGHAIEVDLAQAPPGALRAGNAVLEVVHLRSLGVPPTPREDVTSRPFVVVLHPRIVSTAVGVGGLTVECAPSIGGRQDVVVQLRTPGTPIPVRVLAAPHPAADVTSVDAALDGVAAGTYDAVLVVDGAAERPRHGGRPMTTHVRVHLETLLVDRSVATEAGGIARSVELRAGSAPGPSPPRAPHAARSHASPRRAAAWREPGRGRARRAWLAGAVYDAFDAPGPRPSPPSTRSQR